MWTKILDKLTSYGIFSNTEEGVRRGKQIGEQERKRECRSNSDPKDEMRKICFLILEC